MRSTPRPTSRCCVRSLRSHVKLVFTEIGSFLRLPGPHMHQHGRIFPVSAGVSNLRATDRLRGT